MINVDDVVKLMFFISVSLSILMVAFQASRILGKFADVIQDLRATIKNLGTLSTKITADYELVSNALHGIANFLSNFNENIMKPLSQVMNLFKRFGGRNKQNEGEENFE